MWSDAVLLKRLTFTIWTSFSPILLLSRGLSNKLDLAPHVPSCGWHALDCIGPIKCGTFNLCLASQGCSSVKLHPSAVCIQHGCCSVMSQAIGCTFASLVVLMALLHRC